MTGATEAGPSAAPPSTALPSCALRCQCGNLTGVLVHPRRANRAVCYCHDCQAFAHVLGQAGRVLDPQGGTQILQVLPRQITFTTGAGSLACLRLTPTGLLRWYAGCCATPVGNTLPTPALSFVGLIHACLDPGDVPLAQMFGPDIARVHTASARHAPRPRESGVARTLAWFARTVVRARLTGDHRHTPFFQPRTGAPAATPRVLSPGEHARVMQAVREA